MVDQALGKSVYLPLASFQNLQETIYYHEIIGFEIFDENNNNCGVIRSVNDQTAQVYFITNLDGKEVVIPMIKDWILEVDREERIIKMELPEGLIDVFLVPSKKDE
jgi:16S rRNA processing protein RimM